MSYECNNSKILTNQQIVQNHSLNSQQLQYQVRSLEEQIQFTVTNYESLLQLEKKNSSDRSQFLLFLIQSTRTQQQKQLESLKAELSSALGQKQEARNLEKQMQNIGEGVDSIVEQGKKLKYRNESLQRQLQDQKKKEKQIDQELQSSQKQLEAYRQKVEEWQRTKIKWDRRRKQMLDLITAAEKQINARRLQAMHQEDADMEQDHQINGNNHKYKPKEPKQYRLI